MAPELDFTGLTEDEYAAYAEASLQLPDEDSSTWAARSSRLARDYADKAEARRAEQTADGPTPDESSEAGTDAAQEGTTQGPVSN